MTTTMKDGGDGLFAGELEIHRQNRPGEPRFPGTERYPVPSSANPQRSGGRGADMRDTGGLRGPASRIPMRFCRSTRRVRYIVAFADRRTLFHVRAGNWHRGMALSASPRARVTQSYGSLLTLKCRNIFYAKRVG